MIEFLLINSKEEPNWVYCQAQSSTLVKYLNIHLCLSNDLFLSTKVSIEGRNCIKVGSHLIHHLQLQGLHNDSNNHGNSWWDQVSISNGESSENSSNADDETDHLIDVNESKLRSVVEGCVNNLGRLWGDNLGWLSWNWHHLCV